MRPTKEQIKIITAKENIISLKAAGGTGKTETLAWFVMNRMEYNRIVLLTYTNSAADTMKHLLTCNHYNPNHHLICTIHKFSNKILHKYVNKIGYGKDFKIEPGINNKIIKDMVKDIHPSLTDLDNPEKIIFDINEKFLKSNHKIKKIAREYVQDKEIEHIKKCILKIREKKKKLNVMDFDDLPYYFYTLLKNNKPVVKSLIKKYSLMVVDEFQDTTDIQWKALKILIEHGMRFLGTGDPYQTLYRFAGANVRRFKQLESIPNCAKYELFQNHRSTQDIISLSNAIRAQIHVKNSIWSQKTGPKPLVIVNHQKGLLIKAILDKIRHHVKAGISLNDMAVTYRFNRDANFLIKTLQKEKIPYKIFEKNISTLSDFVLSTIQISMNQGNKMHWEKILFLMKGMGEKNMEVVLRLLEEGNYRIKCLKKLQESRYREGMMKFMDLCMHLHFLKNEPLNAFYAIIDFYTRLKKSKKINLNDHQFATLLNIAGVSKNLEEFVSNYNDPSYEQYHPCNANPALGYLTLCNIHKIKGKGFEVVFILGTDDERFKIQNHDIFKNDKNVIDEIMIMDTAVTRSKRYLYFLFPMTYEDWKKKKHLHNPSIFIKNCSEKLYDVYSVNGQ